MENLTTYQLMALYLLAFQIGEMGPSNQEHIEEAIDQALEANHAEPIESVIFDEDGAPMHSGKEGLYEEFQNWLNTTNTFEIIPLHALQEDNISITPEYLISLIPAE